jgi:hypothetical protein
MKVTVAVVQAGAIPFDTQACVDKAARLVADAARQGAEIVVFPVHGRHSRTGFALQDTWHCIARARAAENLCYVLSTQNLYVSEHFDYRTQLSAGAIVAGPERMEGSRAEPGVLVVDLDMERLRYLRTRNFDEENLSVPDDPNWRPIGCRPGQIYERDPSLYRELAEPSPYSFDYRYWEEGTLDGWLREYDRIYEGGYRRILEKYGGPFRFKEKSGRNRSPGRQPNPRVFCGARGPSRFRGSGQGREKAQRPARRAADPRRARRRRFHRSSPSRKSGRSLRGTRFAILR